MTKTSRASYTLKLKQEALRLVEGGQSISSVTGTTLGVVEQTLLNWVKAHRQGKLKGADAKPMSAELARVQIKRDILAKATAYFARGHG